MPNKYTPIPLKKFWYTSTIIKPFIPNTGDTLREPKKELCYINHMDNTFPFIHIKHYVLLRSLTSISFRIISIHVYYQAIVGGRLSSSLL